MLLTIDQYLLSPFEISRPWHPLKGLLAMCRWLPRWRVLYRCHRNRKMLSVIFHRWSWIVLCVHSWISITASTVRVKTAASVSTWRPTTSVSVLKTTRARTARAWRTTAAPHPAKVHIQSTFSRSSSHPCRVWLLGHFVYRILLTHYWLIGPWFAVTS